jgi:hypothetical protein
MATMVRVSGPPDVTEFERDERRTLKGERLARFRTDLEPTDSGDRGGKPYLIRFFRELH